MATIIDQLIVTLGLDAAGFKKGTGEATRQTKYTQDVIKKSSEAMTRSLKDVTRQVAVMFLGFETATGLVSFLARLNQAQASLSRMALNLGLSARSLDVWDKKIELAGGTAQGAQAAIQQLMSDLTAMLTLGASASPLVILFNKMKVGLDGAAFSGEKAKASYDALFEALGKLPRSTAFELGTQAGLSPDLLNYGLRPPAEREALAKEAERLSRTTEANAKAADDLRERWVAIRESLEAIGVELLSKITPSLERLLPVVEELELHFANWINGLNSGDATSAVDKLSASIDSLNRKLQTLADYWGATWKAFDQTGDQVSDVLSRNTHPFDPNENPDTIFTAHGWSNAWHSLTDWFKGFGEFSTAPYRATFDAATKKYNLPPGLLESIADRESGFNPKAVGKKGELGIMQLRPVYHPDAGKDPNADIFEAAKTLADLYRQFGDNTGEVLAAYNAGNHRISEALAGRATVPASTRQYVTAIGSEMQRARYAGKIDRSGGGSTTTVQIDEVNIHTRATDGQQVAVDFMAEMKKRDLLWQADTGLVP